MSQLLHQAVLGSGWQIFYEVLFREPSVTYLLSLCVLWAGGGGGLTPDQNLYLKSILPPHAVLGEGEEVKKVGKGSQVISTIQPPCPCTTETGVARGLWSLPRSRKRAGK